MKLKTLLTLAFASLCSLQSAWADDVVANVTMKEKNSLSSEILAQSGIDDLKTVTHLTISTNAGVQLGDEDWTTLSTMTALVELDMSNASAEAVPSSQFSRKELVTVKLPKDLKTIGGGAFSGNSKLVTVIVPSTVTTIGEAAFNSCNNLENCDISACQLKEIPDNCFSFCEKLNSFTIPSTVTSIGRGAFLRCGNFTSPLPSGLVNIGQGAFEYAAMTDFDVVIPEGMPVNGDIFYGSGIRSIEFPTTYYLCINCFDHCSNLKTITLKSPTLITKADYYNSVSAVSNASDITLRVPSHLVAAYKSHPVWSKYKDVVAISPAVTDYTVSTDLSLSNSSMRMDGTPNVNFVKYSSLTIYGSAPQVFGDFSASAKVSGWGVSESSMILN